MTNRLLTTVALLGTIGCACSANNQIGGEIPGDGGMVCRGSGLSPTCPLTWEDAQTMVDCFRPPGGASMPTDSSWLGHSEGLLWRSVSNGGQTSNCLYDPATHAAVGGWRTSNVADFCNETSNEIYYGVAGPGRDYTNDLGAGPKCPDLSVPCRKPLADASCPPTWQEAQVEPWLCTLPPGVVHFGHAAGLLARSVDVAPTAQSCYYDPVTFALVGEWSRGNTVLYCDGTSHAVLYGDVVSSGIPFKPDLGESSCPDGGASP
jgi:hypothetical protein